MESNKTIVIPWLYEIDKPYLITNTGDLDIVFECNEDSIIVATANQMRWCELKYGTICRRCEVASQMGPTKTIHFQNTSTNGVEIEEEAYHSGGLWTQEYVAAFRRKIKDNEYYPLGFWLIPRINATNIHYVRIGKFVK